MTVEPISARALTMGYMLALLIIAGLSLASHTALDYSLQSNEGSAAVINKSGRQRMLSQRVASLAAQYQAGDGSVAADLNAAIAEFGSAHSFLIEASRTEAAGSEDALALKDLYFAPSSALDTKVRGFIADATHFLALPPGDPAAKPLLASIVAAARKPLLDGLNAVVVIEQRRSEQRIVQLARLQWAILATVLFTLVIEAVLIFRPMMRRVTNYTSDLIHLATIDSLTGAATRRAFMEKCDIEIERLRQSSHPGSMLMIDVDHFKAINDTYGHAGGDEVLAAVGEALRRTLRKMDVWGRLGGEEFAILLVETALPDAVRTAERLRELFAALDVAYLDQSIRFTVSIGCATLARETSGLADVMRTADELMYRAKQAGRNRVEFDAPALRHG